MLLKNKTIGLIFILCFMFMINYVSADVNYTTGEGVYGVLADGSSTNFLNLTLQFTTCVLSDCSDADWSESYSNSSFISLSSLNNASFFQYKATFFTENQSYTPYLFNVTIDYTYLDETLPLIDFVSPTPLNNSGASGSFTVNVSITEENLKNITYNWNGVLTTFNSSNESLTDLGGGNWIFTYTQSGLVVGQSYTYNVSVSDYAGYTNSTETRTIKGNTAPSFASVSWTPSSNDSMDPNVEISVTANVSDIDANFNYSILQWRNSTEMGWNNVTMDNTTAKGLYTSTNGNFTLPNYEDNITMRVLAIDSVDESGGSVNYTLKSTWDCTWTATSDLGSTAGWDKNNEIGNITINNTGDSEFAGGCSLDFHFVHDLDYLDKDGDKRIYFNNWANNVVYNYYDTSSVSAKSNLTIPINATFLDIVKQEVVTITITESLGRSSTSIRNTTATLVSNQAGPYLYQEMTSSSSTLYLTSQNFSLEGYLRNLMGSSTANENNTAYNVTFNWTLASGFTNVSGNSSINFTNITDNKLHYNNINVSFSNLASMTSGVKTFYLYTQGYDLSGDLIADADNQTLLVDQINITFLCYSTSDGIYVTSCGSLDGDYVAPTSETTTGGGGGGGGGGASVEAVSTSADYQLIRGEQNEVEIIFENRDPNVSISDLVFSVSGKISKYIEISPKELSYLGPGESIPITLIITSPTYIDLGKQELVVTLNGKKGLSGYIDTKKVVLEIHELSIERADEMMLEITDLLKLVDDANLSSDYLYELFNETSTAMETFDLEGVRDRYNMIKEQVGFALDSNEIIDELESLIESAGEKGIGVSESLRLIKLAKLSLGRREFERAYSRAKDAQLTYTLEVKGEFGKLSYYLREYPGELSLGALFLVIFSFGTYKINKLRLVKKKIKKLKEEEKIIGELVKIIQKDCFKDKKMSMEEYDTAMKEYNGKLSKIIEELIELETTRAHMLKFTSKTKKLTLEKEKVVGLIKELQTDYLKKGSVETRTFELKMESFNKRITEIEEKLATLEAKKAMKGVGISMKIPEGK